MIAVDAEAGDVRDRVGEVELVGDLEAFALVLAEDPVDDVASLLRGQLGEPLHRLRPCRSARIAGGKPAVRCRSERLALGDLGQDRGEIEVARDSSSSCRHPHDLVEAGHAGTDLGQAVLAQGQHALLTGHRRDLRLRRRD